ncbi:Alpha/Beta hydrolase protein [Tricladium varicosporioides]|nr:Alpha/Beta hydrolase protein [Hymenoscyphus varicosporioides]
MILGQVSWLDCMVFLAFLAPQLIFRVGFFPTLFCGLRALPFLLVRLPLGFIHERFYRSQDQRTPFVQQASWFEDIVVRCVRYAFAYIPANIGRVFFSKPVSLPFLRFRMLRHGYLRSPIHWREVKQHNFKGIWIINDQSREPDIVIYYAHGGGFSMGSSYFYLEFLLSFIYLLKVEGNFRNPAIFALEYTLVPDSSFPTQLHEAMAGYKYLLSITRNASKICVSGDSAGGTLILSLLLHLASTSKDHATTVKRQSFVLTNEKRRETLRAGSITSATETSKTNGHPNGTPNPLEPTTTPGMAALISPWTTLISPLDVDTPSDYLCASSLHQYALQYAGSKISIDDPIISPGNCTSSDLWKKATPRNGLFFMFGGEEVFAPEIKKLLGRLKEAGCKVGWKEEEGGIHAWPVACLFLSSTGDERLKGLRSLVRAIAEGIMDRKS